MFGTLPMAYNRCTIASLLIVRLLIQRSRHGRSKAALRISEERYLLALAGSTDGLRDWDILSGTVFYSDRFRVILGYSSEEFPATIDSFRSRLHPEDAEAIRAAIDRHLQARGPYKAEYRLQTKSGNIRELENVLERAVINSSGPKLHRVDELKKPQKDLTTTQKTLEVVEREHIVRVLEQTNWKVSGKNGAAEILGLNRSTLRACLRKLDILQP